MKRLLIFCLLPLFTASCMKGLPLNANADKMFDEISKEGPEIDSVEGTLLKSANEASDRGEHEKAVQLYAQLADMNKENTAYQLQLADGLRHIGDYEAADALYTGLLKKEKENIEAQEGKALVKLAQGEFDKAGEMLAEIHAKDKTRWRTLNALGILLVERGSHADATAYFKESLKQKARNPSVLNNIGLNYAVQDDPQNAVKYLMQAIDATPPKSPLKKHVELNLALVMGIFGDLEASEKILKSHLSDAAVANNLGFYAYLANNDELAKGYINTALSNSPYHYERAWKNLNAISKQSTGGKEGKARNVKAKVVKVE